MIFYPDIDDHGHRLRSDAAVGFQDLEQAANTAGYDLYVDSALRGSEEQKSLYAAWEQAGRPADHPVAAPGTSEHELGIAVDLNTQVEEDFRIWLAKNCAAYGWYLTAANEPWHIAFYPLGPPEHLLERHLTNVRDILG